MKEEPKGYSNKLYDFDYETGEKKKSKVKKNKADAKSASKKMANKNLASNKAGQATKRKKYDDEIIIGVTKYQDEKNSINKTQEKNTKRRKNKKNIEQYNVNKINRIDRTSKTNNIAKGKKEVQENIKTIKNKKRRIKIIKILLLFVLVASAITFALLSPIFNIKEIQVLGNKQISEAELKSLSGIKIEENIFKVQNKKVSENINQNAYISEIQVHKILPDTIQIKVVEREPSYMLEYGNGYVYVSSQGYMLEISSIKKEVPILIGTSTLKEDYKAGNRLNKEDLIKLGNAIKIMDSAKNNNIAEMITKIDISDSDDYILHLETERKVAHLGDCSNLETRILFLVGILEKEKNNPGEIFINMNLNTDNAYFRESV